jgi:hypothetical protein
MLDSSMYLAFNLCVLICARARNPSCPWLTAPSGTCAAMAYRNPSRCEPSAAPVYLDEFVFRHNRRKQPMAAFQTLLGLGTGRKPTPYEKIRGAADLSDN